MGVVKEILQEGDGKTFPKKGETVRVHYTGTLTANEEVFDSSYARGEPFETRIGLGHVIRGWDQGVMQMSLGEKAILEISSDLGYGSEGNGAIPPNANLTFEVELLQIRPAPPTPTEPPAPPPKPSDEPELRRRRSPPRPYERPYDRSPDRYYDRDFDRHSDRYSDRHSDRYSDRYERQPDRHDRHSDRYDRHVDRPSDRYSDRHDRRPDRYPDRHNDRRNDRHYDRGRYDRHSPRYSPRRESPPPKEKKEEEEEKKPPPRLWEIPKEERVFDVGKMVQIFGLKSEEGKKLNGKIGEIVFVEEIKGRYQVKLPKDENTKSIKPENIRLASIDTKWRAQDTARIVDLEDDKDKEHNAYNGCLVVLLANGGGKNKKKDKDKLGKAGKDKDADKKEKPSEPEEGRWIVEVKGQLQFVPAKCLRVCSIEENDTRGILGWPWPMLILISFCLIITTAILLGIGLAVIQVTVARIDHVQMPPGLEVALLGLGAPWFAIVWIIGVIAGCHVLHEPLRDPRSFFLQLHEMGTGVQSAKSLYRIGFVSIAMLYSGMLLLHQELAVPHLPGGRSGAKGFDFTMCGLAASAGIAIQGFFLWEIKWSYTSMAHFSGYAIFLIGMWVWMRSAGPLYTPELYLPADGETSSEEYQSMRDAIETAVTSKLLQHEFVAKTIKIRHNILMRLPPAVCVLPFMVRLWENATIKTKTSTTPRMRNALGLAQWLAVLCFAAIFMSFGPELAVAALLPMPSEDSLGGFS